MEDNNTEVKAMRTDPYPMQKNVIPINSLGKVIKFNKYDLSSLSMKQMQFPTMLSWACTVHKFQGNTGKKIVVCFDLIK